MPRSSLLQSRVDSATATLVRFHAERAQMSTSEWIAVVLRRELSRAGTADALSVSSYEMLVTLGYMLRALMIETLGAEPAETAIQDASATAAEEAASALKRAAELR